MVDYKDYNQTQLYAALGYNKSNPTPGRDYQKLWDLAHIFFKEYESSTGRKIPPGRKVDVQEARLCAELFLEQKDVPSKLFPPTAAGFPIWPNDKDEYVSVVWALLF